MCSACESKRKYVAQQPVLAVNCTGLQLRAHGVRVITVRDILAYNVEENVSARVDLEDLAFTALEYEVRHQQ